MTAVEHWQDYDVEAHSPRMQEWLDTYQRRSRNVYDTYHCLRNITYGDHPRQTLDLFPSVRNGNRVLVYIHGGYWRRGAKEDSAHLAAAFVPAGWSFITVEYPLCPEVAFAKVAQSAHRLADALAAITAAQGLREPRFVLSGNSAGAHLAALAAVHRGGAIAGLILLGGIYDLAPLRSMPPQEWLQMTAVEADRFSPANFAHWQPRHPTLFAVGANDRPGLRRQSLAMHRRLQQAGHASQFMVVRDECHFSVAGRMTDPRHELHHAAMRLIDPVNAI